MVFEVGNKAAAKDGPTRDVKLQAKILTETDRGIQVLAYLKGVGVSEYVNDLLEAHVKRKNLPKSKINAAMKKILEEKAEKKRIALEKKKTKK